jgi:hypothetical protein
MLSGERFGKGYGVTGTSTVVTAPTLSELKQKVEEWYASAAARGLEDDRNLWSEDDARKTDDGYQFTVWAHS